MRRFGPSGPSKLALLLAASVLLWGCFEEPVVERLDLRFRQDASVEVRARVDIRTRPEESDDSSFGRRIRQLERQVLAGEDPWSQRFQQLDPERQSFLWEKEEGRLVGAQWTAETDAANRLSRFFADTNVEVEVGFEEVSAAEIGLETAAEASLARGWLALYPGPSNRADRREQRLVADALESWTEVLAAYLEAAEDLYRYLEARPERSRPVLTALYGGLLEEAEEPSLSSDEEERVEALQKELDEVVQVLTLDPDEGYSYNELSHRVYDPFPARVTVEVPGQVLEVEGFARDAMGSGDPGSLDQAGSRGEPGTLTVPGLGFWEAWRALEGVWIFPDPAVSTYLLAQEEDPDAAFPLLLEAERTVQPAPLAGEIRQALENLLRPEPIYRVTWIFAVSLEDGG